MVRCVRGGVRGLLQPGAALVGIWSGGAWLAERLQRDLKLPGGDKGGVRDVVADMKRAGEPIPEPIATRSFSGTLTVRIPPNLHRHLTIEARISRTINLAHPPCAEGSEDLVRTESSVGSQRHQELLSIVDCRMSNERRSH